jgi:rhamnogalacturonyl hydrolase YesR
MPAERMARALVLNEVQKRDRTQNMRKGILRKLEQDPELRQAYQALVKNLPEDQREQAMINIATRTMRQVAPRQDQKAGVKV